MQREDLEFGQGHFVGAIMRDPTFMELTAENQARVLGWANSCPVVEELIEERGAEALASRYAEADIWFVQLTDLVKEVKPDLYAKLTSSVPRKPNEPIGKHEAQSIPDSATREIPPMGQLAGFVLPRLFIEQLGSTKGLPRTEVQDRLVRGIDIFSRAAAMADTPLELLAFTAEGILLNGDVDPQTVLKQVFPKGWLEEHNGHSTMEHFKDTVWEHAPKLYQAYESALTEQPLQHSLA